jgi:hypothetical protein
VNKTPLMFLINQTSSSNFSSFPLKIIFESFESEFLMQFCVGPAEIPNKINIKTSNDKAIKGAKRKIN